MPPTVPEIVDFLNADLEISRFDDISHNGLQVANSGRPGRICCGVDATMDFFEAAADRGAGLLICHHGISWGDSLKRIEGLVYRQVAHLVRHDMALWACHLPLDAHPRHGNNAGLARALALRGIEPFCEYHGQTIGFRGELPRPLPREDFHRRVLRAIGVNDAKFLDFGPATVRRVGVVSGGAAEEVAQAAAAGLDAYVSGEITLQGYNLARQLGVNAVFAGHYATERFGPRALGRLLNERFEADTEFIDLGIPA